MKLPFVVSMKAWVFCSTPWQLWRLWNRIGQSVLENRKRPILIDWITKIWIRGKTKITSLCQIFLKFWHPFLIIIWSAQILYSGSIDPASAAPQFLYAIYVQINNCGLYSHHFSNWDPILFSPLTESKILQRKDCRIHKMELAKSKELNKYCFFFYLCF